VGCPLASGYDGVVPVKANPVPFVESQVSTMSDLPSPGATPAAQQSAAERVARVMAAVETAATPGPGRTGRGLAHDGRAASSAG
jgi:hypothetical protein